MLLYGECLIHSFKLKYSIHGVRGGVWRIAIDGPGQLHTEGETHELTPYGLLDTMLDAGFQSCCRSFPNQRPPEPPLPRPAPRVPETEPEPAVPKRKAFNRRASR
jgi:hypothetical protein